MSRPLSPPTRGSRCFGLKFAACASLERRSGPSVDVCGPPSARYRATEVNPNEANWPSVKMTSPATGASLVRRGTDLHENEGWPQRRLLRAGFRDTTNFEHNSPVNDPDAKYQ